MSPKPLADRIALVTGASRGIGAATALALAKAGAHVVAIARTVGGLAELDDAIRCRLERNLVPLDLKDYDGIDRLALALRAYRKLDVLVGNAGIRALSPLGHIEPKAWDEISPSMSPPIGASSARWVLLKASDAGRAVS